jgi:maltose O-acetyltransferase
MRHVRQSVNRHVNRRWNLIVNVLAATPWLVGEQRMRLYRKGGIDPNTTEIRPGCWFSSDQVTFGPDGMINRGCKFENREPISIGARCYFGPDVLVLTSTHDLGQSRQRAGEYAGQMVTIGDGCWIGARATILPGVRVASGCVVAAGAVVAEDTDPNGLYGGVPARRLRDLDRDSYSKCETPH